MRRRQHEPCHAILGAAELEAVGAPDRQIGALARFDRADVVPREHRSAASRAESRASRHVIASGPPRPRATSSACLTSKKRSERSFDAEPSTPSPTRTPASTSSLTGATPAPSRRLDVDSVQRRPRPTRTSARPPARDGRSARRRDVRSTRARRGTRTGDSRQSPAVSLFHRLSDVCGAGGQAAAPACRVGHQLLRHRERRAGSDRDLHHRARPWLVQPPGHLFSVAASTASASSTTESGGSPPADSPRSIDPREATRMRTPSSRAACTSASTSPVVWRGKT